jgi:hypothetical protein
MKKLLGFLKRIFARPESDELLSIKSYFDRLNSAEPLTLSQATELAIKISSSFESNEGFASVVGDFDGQGLTCGALGFAWKAGRQQPLILECQAKYPGLITELMPDHGENYLSYAEMGVDESMPHIGAWSDSHGVLLSPKLIAELEAFWGSDQMTEIQVDEASQMALTASGDASQWAQAERGEEYNLHEFIFFFDLVVQNGSLEGLTYQSVLNFQKAQGTRAIKTVLNVCGKNSNSDLQENAIVWNKLFKLATDNQQKLFLLAYLRAEKSIPRWFASVMNRRGSLALLQGYVNKSFRDFGSEYPNILNDLVK